MEPAMRRTLRPAKLAEKLSIGVSTMWDKAKNDPAFPKPFKLSPKITLFWDDEADVYLALCADKSRTAVKQAA